MMSHYESHRREPEAHSGSLVSASIADSLDKLAKRLEAIELRLSIPQKNSRVPAGELPVREDSEFRWKTQAKGKTSRSGKAPEFSASAELPFEIPVTNKFQELSADNRYAGVSDADSVEGGRNSPVGGFSSDEEEPISRGTKSKNREISPIVGAPPSKHACTPANKTSTRERADPSSFDQFRWYIESWKSIVADPSTENKWVQQAQLQFQKTKGLKLVQLLFDESPSNRATVKLWRRISNSDREKALYAWNATPLLTQVEILKRWERGYELPPISEEVAPGQKLQPTKTSSSVTNPGSNPGRPGKKSDPSSERAHESIAIIIDGLKDGFSTKIDVLKELMRIAPDIKFKEIQILNRGGVCIIPTVQSRDRASDFFFKKEFPPDAFKGQPFRVHRPGETSTRVNEEDRRRIVIKNVDRTLSTDDLKELLMLARPDPIVPKEIVWLTPRESRQGLVRLEFDAEQEASKLVEAGKIDIACLIHKVVRCEPKAALVQCYNCQDWGHVASICPLKGQAKCLRCGEMGHKAEHCTKPKVTNPDDLLCCNCGEKGHLAFSKTCPRYKSKYAEHQESMKRRSERREYRDAELPRENPWLARQQKQILDSLLNVILPAFVPTERLEEAKRQAENLINEKSGLAKATDRETTSLANNVVSSS